MEILRILVKETMEFCVGLYGFCVLAMVVKALIDLLEGMVNWIGNKIFGSRKARSLRK